ncbi:MAG: NUDIX domain-containing protein [Bacilli bacterium]|nr:NUDIX domain-containing protein [Bacilli bacterium]
MEKNRDINVEIAGVKLNCRAVGIITRDNKILFQKRKQDEFWALPGGKIQVREKSCDTIKRELEEELGVKIKVGRITNISEYFFNFGEEKYHQYILAYNVEVIGNEEILNQDQFRGIEDDENLIFKWFDIAELDKAPIKPDFIKKQLKNSLNETSFSFYEDL